jgi:4-amino-4-deoxy-L-arabinose transferase-like glycosyltransferase
MKSESLATPIPIRRRLNPVSALRSRISAVTVAVLGSIMLVAFFLRVYGVNFGLPHLYYWDEPTVVQRAIRFGSGDLNPQFFYYPALYMYATFIVSGLYFVFGMLTGHFDGVTAFASEFFIDPSGLYLWARVATALIGAACVGLTFWVGRRFFGALAGYLGALFLAVSVIHATHSHIAITDVPQSLFIIAAYLPLFSIVERGRWIDYLLCGLLIGLGMATKYLAVLLVPSVIAAHYLSRTWQPQHAMQWLTHLFDLRLIAAAAAVLLGFFIGSPYNFIEFNAFIADFQQQSILSSGGGEGNSYLFFITRLLPATFGWPLYLVALVGLVLIARQQRRTSWVFLIFPFVYLLFIGRYSLVFPRYAVPLEPFLALAAGVTLAELYRLLQGRLSRSLANAAVALAVLVLIATPLYLTMRWNLMMAHETDSRTLALNWFEQNVPAETAVAVQPLFGRTFYNAPIMTDSRLAQINENIPQGGRFNAVREEVNAALSERPVYREVQFDYDLTALRAAGVEYVLISDQNWPTVVFNRAPADDPRVAFKRDLEAQATAVQSFAPATDLSNLNPAWDVELFPMLPPVVTIYRIN